MGTAMGEIKAIETAYKGYLFRSRLEARWAVFFDALGIQWEYEKEGYDLGEAGWYLPDFWLPQVEMWAEVKPAPFTAEEMRKIQALVACTHNDALMLDGTPTTRNYWGFGWINGQDRESGDDLVYMEDYVLQEAHHYWQTEGRFFCSTGAPAYTVEGLWSHPIGCLCRYCDMDGAVVAARSARFEYGEWPGK